MPTTSQHRPRPVRTYLTRRAATRTAAWSVPVVAGLSAAPAFAGSASAPLTATWLTATWRPRTTPASDDGWAVELLVVNPGSRPATLQTIEMHTTYHAPALNRVSNALVGSATLPPRRWNAGQSSVLTASWTVSHPPTGQQQTNLLPGYYNAPNGIGSPACVSTAAYPGDASYPESGTRLLADSTYLVLTYIVDTTDGSVTVPFTATVGCLVGSGCTS